MRTVYTTNAATADVRDEPRVFFSPDFFREPIPGFTVMWTDGILGGPKGPDTQLCAMVREHHPCHEACMVGVLVRLNEPGRPQRIWKLTGRADTRQEGVVNHLIGYEAIWPD